MAKPDVPNSMHAANGASSISPTDGTSTGLESSTVSRAKKAFKAFDDLQNAAKEVLKYSETIGKVEEVLDRHDAMENASEKKDDEIAKLKSANEVQMDRYVKRWSAWQEEKVQLEHKAENLQNDLDARVRLTEKQKDEHAQSLEQVKKELETERKKVAKLTEELEMERTKAQEADRKLNSCNEQLKEWEENLCLLKEVDFKTFDEKVKKLFTQCSKLARKYFLRDLSKESFSEHARWYKLPEILDVSLSFPPTNSPAAKHMRMAAAMHTVADRLCNNFFIPCYVPESSEAGETLNEILGKQFETSERKERITRALLLSTYTPSDFDKAIKQVVQETADEVCKLLNLIGGGEDSFHKEIKALFYEAANVWKEAQFSTKMVEASTREDETDWQWETLEDFTSPVGENQTQSTVEKVDPLNLFPCVYVPETEHIVNSGCVLWTTQYTVIAAQQEVARCRATRPKRGGRRQSSHGDGVRPAFLDAKERAAKTEEGQPPGGNSGG